MWIPSRWIWSRVQCFSDLKDYLLAEYAVDSEKTESAEHVRVIVRAIEVGGIHFLGKKHCTLSYSIRQAVRNAISNHLQNVISDPSGQRWRLLRIVLECSLATPHRSYLLWGVHNFHSYFSFPKLPSTVQSISPLWRYLSSFTCFNKRLVFLEITPGVRSLAGWNVAGKKRMVISTSSWSNILILNVLFTVIKHQTQKGCHCHGFWAFVSSQLLSRRTLCILVMSNKRRPKPKPLLMN